MSLHVIVQVSEDVAQTLHQRGPPTTGSQELLKIAEELGVELEPLHPGVEDLSLARYFVVEAPDPATAQLVVAHLQGSNAVEAAYLKPPGEPPGEMP